MTHLKLLTALTAFVLLTACAGGVAINNTTNINTLTTACAANAFGASCIAEDINVEARITDCITAGNAGDTKCASLTSDAAMNTAINTCLTNPFDDTCTESEFTFSTYVEMARTNRVSFCETAGNETHDLCPTFVRECIENPFGATCDVYFESAKVPYCEANDVADCPNVTAADWVGGFQNPPNTAASFTGRASFHEFLQGTAVGLNPGTVKNFRNTPHVHALNFTSLGGDKENGVAWFFGGSGPFGEDVRSRRNINTFEFDPLTRLYAGILSGTSLGAPLTTADVSVSVPWEARIRWTFLALAINIPSTPISEITNFTLTVDFANSKISGFANGEGAEHFLLKATFDDTGWFTGRITHGIFAGNDKDATPTNATPGALTGIIGKEGAVGAFISDQNHGFISGGLLVQRAFVGGFIARPPTAAELTERAQELLDSQVTYTDWVGSFTGGEALPTTPNATRKNEFLQGTTTGFASGATDGIMIPSNTPSAVNIKTVKFGNTDTATGGVAFFNGGVYGDNGVRVGTDEFYYAGILADTNLGAPITETITNARWNGEIRASSSNDDVDFTKTDFELDITFDGATGTMDTFFETAGGYYLIDGMFDANGIISGDIAFATNATGSGDSRTINTGHNTYSPGTLSGIIGSGGAVGAFYSGHATITGGTGASLHPYAGGFVVTSPAFDGKVSYFDWVNITPPSALTSTPAPTNQFLTTTDGDLDGVLDLITQENLNLSTATFNEVALGGETDDGIAYTGYLAGNTNVFVSGILSTTNLGAALTAETAKGTWNGSVAVGKFTTVVSSFETYDFTLEVLFDTSTVNSGVIGDTGDTDLTFTGMFNPRGVITGTTASTANGAGVMQGLIGEQGAVGVFHSTAVGGYGGGFVARKAP